jgi:hypothetical protein
VPTRAAKGPFYRRPQIYTPICVVEAKGRYYIIDGNDRFYELMCRRGGRTQIPCWVLCEEDREEVHAAPGTALPPLLSDWKRGAISLDQIRQILVEHASATQTDDG